MDRSLLQVSAEVQEALASGRPVVALESSVWCQGLPAPLGLQAALEAQDIIRHEGAVPAILAVRHGRCQIGLSNAELQDMCEAPSVVKLSLLELPLALALNWWGATTVSASLALCQAAGIEIFSTGGIGGVHRHSVWDVSTDLVALGQHAVVVFCSGAKSLLDIPATLERLETEGVAVVGYRTDSFPIFYSRSSRFDVSAVARTEADVVRIVETCRRLSWSRSVLIVQPVPEAVEIKADALEALLEDAHQAASLAGVAGKRLTPFVLKYLHEHTQGRSLAANQALLRENARLAARVAVQSRKA